MNSSPSLNLGFISEVCGKLSAIQSQNPEKHQVHCIKSYWSKEKVNCLIS